MHIAGDSRLTDRRVLEWYLLEKARREERTEQRHRSGVQPIITISRQYGAGGHTIAEKLVNRLGDQWQVWDKEIIDAIARSAHERMEMVEALDEHTKSWMEEMIQSLFGVRFMEPHAYRRHLAQIMLALAHHGYKVIVGRGANFVLPDALNVRLEAGIGFRTDVIMKRDNVSREEAVHRIHVNDRERAEFTRRIFERDIDDRRGYDMIIESDTLGFDTATTAIVAAAQTMFSITREGKQPIHA